MIRILLTILKKMIITLSLLLVVLVLAGYGFVKLSPEFGGKVTEEMKKEYSRSAHHNGDKFTNIGQVQMNTSFKHMVQITRKWMADQTQNTTPDFELPVERIDSVQLEKNRDSTRLIWFGHSTFLLQMDGKNILIDPMFGPVPAPHPWLGTNRFSEELPIEIEKLPQIDLVVISHDHYDHLDYGSIKKLEDKVGLFLTPLAVGVHLEEWGIERSRIKEFDWWQDEQILDLEISCTPAQHFSGRGLGDRGQTMWASWIIKGKKENLFFSGDSGYGPHFKEIGEKYGPFDLALIECGQYNEMWHEIHMFPEETAQAGIDLEANRIMPIHWGAFKLAMHSWIDPVERVTLRAAELGIPVITPRIGVGFGLSHPDLDSSKWWSPMMLSANSSLQSEMP